MGFLNQFWEYAVFYFVVDTTVIMSVAIDRRRLLSNLGMEITPAGLGVRALAQLVDIFLAMLLGWLLFGILFMLYRSLIAGGEMNRLLATHFWGIFVVLVGTIHCVYSVLCTGAFGKTIGKSMLRMRVESFDGGIPTYRVAFLRYISYGLFFLTAGYGFVDLARNAQKQGFHDRICGTRVIYTGFPSFVVAAGVLLIFHIIGLMRPG